MADALNCLIFFEFTTQLQYLSPYYFVFFLRFPFFFLLYDSSKILPFSISSEIGASFSWASLDGYLFWEGNFHSWGIDGVHRFFLSSTNSFFFGRGRGSFLLLLQVSAIAALGFLYFSLKAVLGPSHFKALYTSWISVAIWDNVADIVWKHCPLDLYFPYCSLLIHICTFFNFTDKLT